MVKKKKKGLFKTILGFDDLAKNLKFTKKLVTEDSNKVSFTETFDEAMERFNIAPSERDAFLEKKYNDLRGISITNYIISLLMFFAFIYYINSQSLFYILMPILFFTYFLLKGMECSLRCYQIRNQELGLLKEFLKDKKFWIPPKGLNKNEH